MKKILFAIIVFIFVFAGCEDPTFVLTLDVPVYDIDIDLEIRGDTLNQKLDCIDAWIFANVIMKTDEEIHGESYWQTPEETVKLKTGDCEDFCILFMWLCYQYLNMKPDMLILRRWGEDHTIVDYRDYIFLDYYNWYENGDYIYIDTYSWNKTMIYAEYVK